MGNNTTFENQNAQVNHFKARFRRGMKENDSFMLDNLGNLVKDRPARKWKIYDSFDEMVTNNLQVVSTGDRTHYFSFLRSLGVEAFAIAKI